MIVTDIGRKHTRFYFSKGFGMMYVNYKICCLCDAVTTIKPVALYLQICVIMKKELCVCVSNYVLLSGVEMCVRSLTILNLMWLKVEIWKEWEEIGEQQQNKEEVGDW